MLIDNFLSVLQVLIFSYTNAFYKTPILEFKDVCHFRIDQRPAATYMYSSHENKFDQRSARFENEAGPAKTKRGVQMAVHERNISKFLLCTTQGDRPTNVERNYYILDNSDSVLKMHSVDPHAF